MRNHVRSGLVRSLHYPPSMKTTRWPELTERELNRAHDIARALLKQMKEEFGHLGEACETLALEVIERAVRNEVLSIEEAGSERDW